MTDRPRWTRDDVRRAAAMALAVSVVGVPVGLIQAPPADWWKLAWAIPAWAVFLFVGILLVPAALDLGPNGRTGEWGFRDLPPGRRALVAAAGTAFLTVATGLAFLTAR